MSPSPLRRHHRPLYRTVLRHAFQIAWRDRQFWPIAIFASLLFSAGSSDILLRSVDAITNQTEPFGYSASNMQRVLEHLWNTSADFFSVSMGIQTLLVLTIFAISLIVFSCVCQAGLVYAIGATRRGSRPTLLQAIHVGGNAFWPVAALNALVLAVLWILRFLTSFPLALTLDRPTPDNFALYLLAFLFFVILSFVVTMVHIFALNALVLQGVPIAEALLRGYTVFKKHWLIAIETSLLLFCIALGIIAGFIVVFFLLLIPFLAALIAAATLGSQLLWSALMTIGMLLFLGGCLATVAFLTHLHYATWTLLYRALGEGGALPKLHRWVRGLFGAYGSIH